MLVLDTDVLIDVQRAHAAAVAWFASVTDLPSVPGQQGRNTQTSVVTTVQA